MTLLPCDHDERHYQRGECQRCAADADIRRAGFRGYDGCPVTECPTPFVCSEFGDCREDAS